MENQSILKTTHPLFKVAATRIFWFGTVHKKNTHGVYQQRILAIATPGIFLLERRTFPRGLVISRIIPFAELLLIRIDNESMQFFCPKITMVLQHPDQLEVVSIVLKIRQALFGDRPRPPKLDIPKDKLEKIHSSTFQFESSAILADRFLSFCVSVPPNMLSIDQINDLYDQLSTTTVSISFTPEIITSPLVTPMAQAVSYDSKIKTLKIVNSNVSLFLPQLSLIFQNNSSIDHIIFASATFVGSTKRFANSIDGKSSFKATKISFSESQLNSHDFCYFFESFSNYPGKIQELSFYHSNMTKDSLDSVFQTIMIAPCFKSLSELSFSNINSSDAIQINAMQLFSCSFLVEQDQLNSINMSNCGLSLENVFPLLLMFDTCVTSVNFSGNKFYSSDQIPMTDFKRLEEISLAECSFSPSSLTALFKALAKATNSPARLILNGLKLDENGWNTFYSSLDEIVLPHLTTLSWCQNPMTVDQFQKFSKFMMKQPKLVNLGLSESLKGPNVEKSLACLADLVKSRPIESLEFIGGINESVCGEKLIPVLEAFLAQSTIKKLDIRRQYFADKGLEIISQLAMRCLDSLMYDEANPSSADVFLQCANKVLSSSISYCEWPHKDAQTILNRIPIAQKQALLTQMQQLEKQFAQKYSLPDEAVDSALSIPKSLRNNSILTLKRRSNSFIGLNQTEYLRFKEPKIEAIVCECLNIKGPEYLQDPLVKLYMEMENETSIEKFLQSEHL